MNFKLSGLIAFEVRADLTILASLSEQLQSWEVPGELPIRTANNLDKADVVLKTDRTLVFNQPAVVQVVTDNSFGEVRILPVDSKSGQELSRLVYSEIKTQFGADFSKLEAMLNDLSEKGPTLKLLYALTKVEWGVIVLELLQIFPKHFPEIWSKFVDKLDPEDRAKIDKVMVALKEAQE